MLDWLLGVDASWGSSIGYKVTARKLTDVIGTLAKNTGYALENLVMSLNSLANIALDDD